MSKRAAAKAKAEEPESAEDLEHRRRQDAAFDLGLLSRTRRLCNEALPPTRLMQRAGGKDIVKKSSSRKGRYLLLFNFQLAPAAAGKLGTLAQLDSKNPVMYLDFPQGRYKLFGTLVFPRNKYAVLRLGQKEVLCEDVFESMVVFSEGWWVGSAEENPEERRLPEPDWLAQPPIHHKFDFSSRGDATAGATGKEAEAAEEEEGEEEEAGPASQRPQRSARRAPGGKRLRYNEDSDAEEEEEEEGSEAEDAAPRKLQRVGSQQQRAARKVQAKQQPESHPIDLAGDSSGDEGGEPLAARAAKAQQGTLDAFVKQPAAAKARAPAAKPRSAAKKKRAESSEESDVVDLAGSSSEEEAAEEEAPSQQRPRSQRKAAGAAAKKLRVEDEDEGEEAGSGDDPIEEASDEEAGGSGADDASEEASEASEASEDEASDYEPSE